MQKNGFTFTEILIVLVLVGTLAGLGVNGFKHARAAHRIDSLLQELTLLRTAILSYKETYGCLPEITEGELSSSSFNVLKPFWYPFHPENSKVIKGGKWHGQINSNPNDSFLYLKQGEKTIAFDTDLLRKKIQKLCNISLDGTYFYIFQEYIDLSDTNNSDVATN